MNGQGLIGLNRDPGIKVIADVSDALSGHLEYYFYAA